MREKCDITIEVRYNATNFLLMLSIPSTPHLAPLIPAAIRVEHQPSTSRLLNRLLSHYGGGCSAGSQVQYVDVPMPAPTSTWQLPCFSHVCIHLANSCSRPVALGPHKLPVRCHPQKLLHILYCSYSICLPP